MMEMLLSNFKDKITFLIIIVTEPTVECSHQTLKLTLFL